ncbi:hypothetical protein BaRGS_00001042 [Batillaria attramentaria]|uniref:FAM86 N-terminal domain-containing protein n=1 Tax=Batillaria attramentaria TaxID=370345 RepID=A0ABD0M9K7_9CAEN
MAASCDSKLSCRREHVDELLDRLSTQFLEMVPIRKMKWKDEETAVLVATAQLQQRVLQATVLHPVCRLHPPALSYRTTFMKQLVHKLEQLGAEVCDEVYETYTDLLMQREDEEDMLCYKNYTLPWGEKVSLQESVNLVSQGTTGLSTWQAAQHLAEWVLENPDILREKQVVELGCGLGLTGVVVCRACSIQSYTFTDCHAQVLFLLAKNIERNLALPCADNRLASGAENGCARERKMMRKIKRQLSLTSDKTDGAAASASDRISNHDVGDTEVEVMTSPTKSITTDLEEKPEEDEDVSVSEDIGNVAGVRLEVSAAHWDLDETGQIATLRADPSIRICYLNWEQCQDRVAEQLEADVILGADVVYDPSIIPSLVCLLRQLLEPGPGKPNKKAFIASTVRNEDTRDAFLIALSSEGLSYSVVEGPQEVYFHYERMVPIEILEITAP